MLSMLPFASLTLSLTAMGSAGIDDDTLAEQVRPEVVDAASRGLAWLAEHQMDNGAWSADVGYKLRVDYKVLSPSSPHVGVTALAGMAFLAGGHVPGRGQYGKPLDACIEFLLDQVGDLGFVTSHSTRMYSHAFATLFLAEVVGMVDSPRLRTKLQHAVDLIVASQNDKGSWRYEPFVSESDMSITVCQLMALRAARNIGIRVPASTIERAVEYVRSSLITESSYRSGNRYPSGYYISRPGAFQYQIADDQRSSFALTAAGIVSMYHAGQYDVAFLRQSLDVLNDARAIMSKGWVGHYFYYYGHYYAAQAAFLTGNLGRQDYWQSYWRDVSDELLAHQKKDGSWPNDPGPGRAFGTAVACIVLQVPYRYLPILQK